jgi:dipeptidyl aminopeptidase/acylaminoacyl peptidase
MTVQQRALRLESLVSAGGITGLDISPDGRFVVFGSTAGGPSQIFVQSLDGGEPRQITHGAEAASYPKWSPAGDLIAFRSDIGGDENYQIYVVSPEGGEPRSITNRPGTMHENHSWSWDGSRIAFVSNREGTLDVYFADVATGEVRRVTNYPSVHHGPRFSPDGSMIAFASNRTELRSNWDTFVVSLADGRERKITQHEGEADEMSYYAGQEPRWHPDGRRVLVGSDVQGNYDIKAIDVHTLEQEWIVQSPWDESNAQWSPDGSRVAFVVNEDGNTSLHVKTLGEEGSTRVSQPEGVAGTIGMRGWGPDYRWTPDGKNLVYGYSGPKEAGSIWMVPAAGGEEPRCLYSTLPADLDPGDLVTPELIHYPSFDGLQISAILFRPRGAQGRVPSIVYPHGGPTGQTVNGWNPLVQYLVSRGFAVLAPNFRGSTGYGSKFQWLNRNDWGGGDLQDVVHGANWLEENGISSSIGISGGSYGGYMTMIAITKAPQRWQAAANIFGIVNLVTMYQNSRPDMRLFQERNIGSPQENPELYHDRSPINFIENIQCPVLILQGERDPRVPLAEAEQVRDRLEATGKPYEYVVYEHEGHGFARKEHQLDFMRRIADFLEKHLL